MSEPVLPSPSNGPAPTEERDFTAGGILSLAEKPKGTTGDRALDEQLKKLASRWVSEPRKRDLVAGMLMTSLKIGRDDATLGDLKLLHRALREMRYANKVFHPWRNVRKVSVFGSARTHSDDPVYQAADLFAKRMVQAGYMVITGAGDGIMGAAQHGAGRENGFGLNIKLPFEQHANEEIVGDEKLMTFNYFFTRKLSFVKEADAFAMFPGGFGTMDELFESITLIQTGKANILPVVLVDIPGGSYWKTFVSFIEQQLLGRGLISSLDLQLFRVVDSVDAAVHELTTFYRVFHSYRHVGDKTVFRLKRKLAAQAVERLNKDFADLLKAPSVLVQSTALPEEANEEGIFHLPRLIGVLKRGEFGRWRQLIDAINQAQLVPMKL